MKYVMHDDQRWGVRNLTDIDGELAYDLIRRAPGHPAQTLTARVKDCTPVDAKPKKRRIVERKENGDAEYVLELDGRVMTIRRSKSRRRYPVTLAGIFSSAVKAAVAAERFAKAKAKGNYKVQRGQLKGR